MRPLFTCIAVLCCTTMAAAQPCDDGIFCNGEETCVDGVCQSGTSPCGDQLCDEATKTCIACTSDAECDNGLFCDGAETCVGGQCMDGADPCVGKKCRESDDKCVDCLGDADCDDGAFCNGAETCVNGQCRDNADPCSGDQICDEASDTCRDPAPEPGGVGIGIPTPSFGLTEELPTYTHYVNNDHGSATDTNNANGSPSKPRATIPSPIPAGSAVYLAGGTYSITHLRGNGTAANPVFLFGNPAGPPTFRKELKFSGTYFIIDNVLFDNVLNGSSIVVIGPSHHIAVRNCEVKNGNGTAAGLVATGSWDGGSSDTVTQIVFYKNKVHDMGNMSASSDQDHHGCVIGHHANYIWLLENEIWNTSGSGLQVNSGYLDETGDRPAHHIFVSKNHIHHTRQSGLALKKCRDVVFSQNHVHHVIDTPWSTGKALSYQYSPYNVWFIYNKLHDTTWGINGPSNTSLPSGKLYFVGNVIYDCHHAMNFWNNNQTAYMVANTISDVDVGIELFNSPGMHLKNNVFTDVSDKVLIVSGRSGATAAASTTEHDLFWNGGGPVKFEWGGITYSSLSALQSGSGKGATSLHADPKFANPTVKNFHLQAGSPCIDSGVTPSEYATYLAFFGESIAVDFDGKARTGVHDVGAFESK